MEQKLWDIVNDCETIEDVDDAIDKVKEAHTQYNITNEIYNDLMRVLSYLRIEVIHRERWRKFNRATC